MTAIGNRASHSGRARFKQRMRLLRLLLRAGPGRAIGLTVIYVASAAVLPAIAISTGLLAREAVALIRSQSGDLGGLVVPLSLVGVLLVLEQVLPVLAAPLELSVAKRVEGAVRDEVRALAMSTATIRPLEDPKFHDTADVAFGSHIFVRSGDRTMGTGAASQLSVVVGFVAAAGTAVLLARFSPWLAATLFFATWYLDVRLTGQYWAWEAAREAQAPGVRWSRYWSEMAGGHQSAKEVRMFGLASWLSGRFERLAFSARAEAEGVGLQVVRSNWISFAAQFAIVGATFVFLGLAAGRGDITAGEFTTFVLLVFAIITLQSGGSLQVESAIISLDALDRLREMAHAGEAPAPSPRLAPADNPRQIRIEHVSFRYTPDTPLVLDDLTLDINAAESLAIVGVNGAGKTTLIKLLTGLYAPDRGRILVDGVDLAEIDQDWWRSRLAVIFQDYVSYPLSARENVKLGTRASLLGDRELDMAASTAGAAGVVEGLPKGWETPLSRRYEGGADLSGGEWQRIILARALYAERAGASVLVLDEPTANLDPRGEAEIFATLLGRSTTSTRIIISHRLSSVRDADRIVLIKDGSVAEAGSHNELIALGGEYAAMFETQAARFREETEEAPQ